MIEQWTQEQLQQKLAEMQAGLATRDPNDPTFWDYQTEYLPSKLWAKIKRRVLKRDNKVCASCGGRGNIVHHRSYAREVLLGEADEMLVTVCETCHTYIHFLPDGSKRDDSEWDAALKTGLRDTTIPEPKIDLRRRFQIKPPEWERMSAMQRSLYQKREHLLWYEKRIAKGETELIEVVAQLRAKGRL